MNINKQSPYPSVWLQHHTKKVTYSLLTDTPIAVSVFLQLLDSAVVRLVGPLYGKFQNNTCASKANISLPEQLTGVIAPLFVS
jgi:hypothetical protein